MHGELGTIAFRDRRLAAAAVLARLESAACQVPGCPNATSDKKPYCLVHLDGLPYVRELRLELSRRATEEAAATAGRGRALDPSGTRAQEIVEELERRGAQTLERLARTLNIPARAVEGYVRALEGAGRVRTLRVRSRRGGFRRLVARRLLSPALQTAS